MRRSFTPLLVLLFLFLAVTAGLIWQKQGPHDWTESAEKEASSTRQLQVSEPNTHQIQSGTIQKTASPSTTNADPARYRRAYLLCLNEGTLSLQKTEDIEGDFAPRRRAAEEWSGMLRCRLVSSEGEVLAEELIPAPDRVCTVLDSQEGTSQPAKFTVPGPVIFQLRLPRLSDATRLDVSRITGPGTLAHDVTVGSVSLATP